MTSQLEAAVAAIQALSPTERQQLLQMLTQNDFSPPSQPDLKMLIDQFWQGTSLSQLLTDQTPATVHDLKALMAAFWPEEDSIEDFLAFLRQQCQEDI